jgi:hypothetical protein
MEVIFELGTTVENYGEYHRTTGKSAVDSRAGPDPYDQLGGRYGTDSKPTQ